MHPLDEMKAYIEFGPEDERHLRALWVHVEAVRERIVGDFYRRVFDNPATAKVLADPARVAGLHKSLSRWMGTLLKGPWDEKYYEARVCIGHRHVEVGLAHQFMHTAMAGVVNDLANVATACLPTEQLGPTFLAINRVTSMDLAIMTGTYMLRRERDQLDTLQGVIISHMPVTLFLLDVNDLVQAATKSGQRLFAWGDAPEGRPVTDVLPRELVHAADIRGALARAHATQNPVERPRIDVVLQGRRRAFCMTIVPLEHSSARALLHIEEITVAIATETALRRAETLAQLGTMSAAVAHELRNPLAGISGAVQVMSGTFGAGDPRKGVMDKITDQIGRLDRLVSDLLEFARPTEARLQAIALADVVRTVGGLVAQEHDSLDLRVEGKGTALADPHLVQQILLNLLQNAAQATGGDGPILVRVRNGELLVCDGGPGLSASVRKRLFQPFHTTKVRGTGLGLAICKKLVDSMGGSIELVEGPLSGAAFLVELPVVPR